ncbi:LANO_0H06172g1_1 [Lachancea nothofagi CBS 11611]|uniref:tRNA wybutosine-synthesizing protein 2 n=1 Tax=Lachancea nothofagi CBS 11611 TaxID=1266666 RepID=A0A1G4KLF4_9SACH|nr:LANO_0H06172g1_1 [Lachancea nothofagi CBS 11611]
MSKTELLVADVGCLKQIKTILEQRSAYVRPIGYENGLKVVRTSLAKDDITIKHILSQYNGVEMREYKDGTPDICLDRISKFAERFLKINGADSEDIDVLLKHVPLRYSLYEPVVLFNNSVERSFLKENWREALSRPQNKDFMKSMLTQLFPNFTHVATNRPIVEYDAMRRPFHIESLEGVLFDGQAVQQTWDHPTQQDFKSSVWCHVVQNGIHQVWSPVFTMFSRGNIKEKKRILDPKSFSDIEGYDVVDLYAGIGYFTLSYLKRQASRAFCFELNPWSTEGLRRGAILNKFTTNCHIFQESNENCLKRLANYDAVHVRHINLGLLPSSIQGYPWALEIVERYGVSPVTTLHIHENIHVNDIASGQFSRNVLRHLQEVKPQFKYTLTHLEKVKTFAPDVWHCVLDVDVAHNK